MLVVDGFEIEQDILDGFLDDSFEVLSACYQAMDEFTSTKEEKQFENFGQSIDRIMGAALTLGFKTLGQLAKYGKEIGYKASQVTDINKLLSLQSILLQISKEIEKILKKIKKSDLSESEESLKLLEKCEIINLGLGDLWASVKF